MPARTTKNAGALVAPESGEGRDLFLEGGTRPEKAPCSAIWARLSSTASTRPSTTNVPQSLISAPFNLMSGPTMRRLPWTGSALTSAFGGSGCGSGRGAGVTAASGLRAGAVPGRCGGWGSLCLPKSCILSSMETP